MNAPALLSLSIEPIARKIDAWRLAREIKRTERDLELTKKEIEEKLKAKSALQTYLKHLQGQQ